MDYKQKYLKYKQKYLNLKNQIGGVQKHVPLTQINIHYSMLRMANKIQDLTGIAPPVELNNSLYSKYYKVQPLSIVGEPKDDKIRPIMELSNDEFQALLLREPVKLIYDTESDPENPMYDIADGRHRVIRAIFYNLPTIYAEVTGEPVAAPIPKPVAAPIPKPLEAP
jgi:hypothetical protein